MRGWRSERRPFYLLSCLAVILALRPMTVVAQEQPTEIQVKAAFLFNFVKFVEWPAESFRENGGRIRLCVLGEDRFAQELERIAAGKVVSGRALEVVRASQGERVLRCQILFIGAAQNAMGRKALAESRSESVLTVGENAEFLRQGGVIRLFLLDSRIRFEINLEASERAGLKVSSKLLALAQSVRGAPAGGG
jgi:hypothetical protein